MTTRITTRQIRRRDVAKTTGTYALDTTYDLILCDCSAGAITLNLPAAASSEGFSYAITKTDSGANTVTIDGNGAETVNGETTQVISKQYTSITVVCDGTGWNIV